MVRLKTKPKQDIFNEHLNQSFYDKLRELPRDKILEIIKTQSLDTIKEVKRIEYVFRHNMSHLNDDQGKPITERDLTQSDLMRLIDPPFIFSKELAKAGFNEEAQRQIHTASDPVLWAKEFLNAKPRVYQTLMLRSPSKKRVMRFGRRMGKTYSMAMLILWYAYVNKNARVLVMAPMKAHVQLIYEAVMEFAEGSPVVMNSIERHVTSPQYEIDMKNGSTIKFFTTGMKSGGKSNVARGQEADLIILDELDYMGQEDLVALYAMMQDTSPNKLTQKMLVGASTPTGLRGKFWEWNTDPKLRFEAFWFPSYANPMWTRETEEEMRMEYPNEHHYRHEIEADWGEVEEGVYPRWAIDRAFMTDEEAWEYRLAPELYEAGSNYIMGVDWDKYGAGVNIVCLEVCGPDYQEEELRGKVRMVFREEISKGEFTYTAAVERILELDKIFYFDHIYVDRGAGEMQIEVLKKVGMENPEARQIHKRIKGWQFSETIEVPDPLTQEMNKKEIKAFMVDNLYRMLEKEQIKFSDNDDEMYFQLISYVILRHSAYGKPVFGPGGSAVDHAHDALILAALAVAQHYDDLLSVRYARKAKAISNEVFNNLFALDTTEDVELAKEKWGDTGSAPVFTKRAFTARIRGGDRNPTGIKRKMF